MAKKRLQPKKTPSVKKAKKVSVWKAKRKKKAKAVPANKAKGMEKKTHPKKGAVTTLTAGNGHVEDDQLRDFFRRVHDEVVPRIAAATVPIYGCQDNQVKLDRTGILFRLVDTHFILTAAHKLLKIVGYEIPLYADFGKTKRIPIPLVKAQFHATEEDNGRDVAAIELPTSVVEEFLAERQFLTLADLDTAPISKEGCYAVFGFPSAWFTKVDRVYRTEPLVYLASIYEGDRNPDSFFDSRVHIALQFDQRCRNVFTQEEKMLPKINGVSGCGVWRIVNSDSDIATWNAEKVRLVAIQHRWFDQRRYVQGTWIAYALRLIWDEYPSLRGALNLSYPSGY